MKICKMMNQAIFSIASRNQNRKNNGGGITVVYDINNSIAYINKSNR